MTGSLQYYLQGLAFFDQRADICHRIAFYATRTEKVNHIFQQSDIITASIDEVSSNAKPILRQVLKLPKKLKLLMDKIPHQEVCVESTFSYSSY